MKLVQWQLTLQQAAKVIEVLSFVSAPAASFLAVGTREIVALDIRQSHTF